MSKERLEAFTDGVLAVVITIMVLDLKMPPGSTFSSLASSVPVLLAYVLSFANVGIFWNNHHHMLQVTERINGLVPWANLFLLFWMSLVPFAIRWMDDTHFAAAPTAAYGIVLAMSAVAYILLEIHHRVQRPPLEAGTRGGQRCEKQGVAIDLRAGDSPGVCAAVDRAGVVRLERRALVHT